MNEPNAQTDWEKRLQELEAEVNEQSNQQQTTAEQSYVSESSPLNSNSTKFSNQFQKISRQVTRWFHDLPIVGKVIVVAIGLGIGFSLLKTVFQLITSLLTLAIIGGLGYVGYQVLIKSKYTNND